MPILRMKYRMSERGLMILGPREVTDPQALRRTRGFAGRRSRSFASRPGSSLIASVDAHSIIVWQTNGYGGVGTDFVKITGGGGVIKSGLLGERLTFCTMPPTSGFADALFVCGGGLGRLFKIHLAGVLFNWGIAPPTTTCVAALGGAGNLKGHYKYYYTFGCSSTGSESNPFPVPVEIDVNNQIVLLTAIGVSPDAQVDRRFIYRTVGNGTVPFLVGTLGNNLATVFTDNFADTQLASIELAFDNLSPSDPSFDFRECVGAPHLGRMWWTRDAIQGHGGRIYYSPVGRAEAVQGYIEPASNDDPMQRIIAWNGSLWGFSKHRIFEVIGDSEPFTYRDVTGAVGTDWLWSVVPTPYGIIYRNRDDEIKNFNGVQSVSLEGGFLGDVLKGESLENFPVGFAGAYGGFGNDEYWLGDGVNTTLILYLAGDKPTWRELGGLGMKALYTTASGAIAVSANSKLLFFDDITLATDGGSAIPFEIELASQETDPAGEGILQRLMIEADTNNQAIVPKLIYETAEITLPTFSSANRETFEYALSYPGRILGLRFSHVGLTSKLDIAEIDIDLYFPEQERKFVGFS